jgi:hypothetical protein
MNMFRIERLAGILVGVMWDRNIAFVEKLFQKWGRFKDFRMMSCGIVAYTDINNINIIPCLCHFISGRGST